MSLNISDGGLHFMLTNDKHLFVVLIVLPLTFFLLHNAQPFAMIVEYSQTILANRTAFSHNKLFLHLFLIPGIECVFQGKTEVQ